MYGYLEPKGALPLEIVKLQYFEGYFYVTHRLKIYNKQVTNKWDLCHGQIPYTSTVWDDLDTLQAYLKYRKLL
jgi:hypothetical protein